MWTALTRDMYDIRLHRGDNFNSDIIQAFNHGVMAEWTHHHLLTKTEQSLVDHDMKDLALLLRRFRHGNPHPVGTKPFLIYDEQAQINLPALLLLTVELKAIVLREGLSRILLTTRDGCLLEKLLLALQTYSFSPPNVTIVHYHSSRIVNLYPSPAYLDYVKEVYVPGQSIIFDLHGVFSTGRQVYSTVFGAGFHPRVHLLSAGFADFVGASSQVYEGLSWSLVDRGNIETFNLDVVGQLLLVYNDEESEVLGGERVFLRGAINSYSLDLAVEMHHTLEQFCSQHYLPKIVPILQRIYDLRETLLPILRPLVRASIGDANSSAVTNLDDFGDYHRPIAASAHGLSGRNLAPPFGQDGQGDVLSVELLQLKHRSSLFQSEDSFELRALFVDPTDMTMSTCRLATQTSSLNMWNETQVGSMPVEERETFAVATLLTWFFQSIRYRTLYRFADVEEGRRQDSATSCLTLADNATSINLVLEKINCSAPAGSLQDVISRIDRLQSTMMAGVSLHALFFPIDTSECFSLHGTPAPSLSLPSTSMMKCCPSVLGKRCTYFRGDLSLEQIFLVLSNEVTTTHTCFLWSGLQDPYNSHIR